MKAQEASDLLKKAINTQKTIKTDKLRNILIALNVSYNDPQKNKGTAYLRNEFQKLKMENQTLQKRNGRLVSDNSQLKSQFKKIKNEKRGMTYGEEVIERNNGDRS